jgi:hypothetical protein
VLPFVALSSGSGTVEVRGGWRGYTQSYAGAATPRNVFEAGARAAYGGTVRVMADARWVYASEGTYPFVGGTLVYGGGPVHAWVQAGRWLSTTLDDVTWGAGVRIPLDSRAAVWASVRQDATDPLYWNVTRRSWSVGVTRLLGRPHAAMPPPPVRRSAAEPVVIRIRAADAPGTEVSIAGDFSDWQPQAMQRDGGAWVARLALAPGVYHYAFRAGTEWFVPSSVPGRRDDGMGGHVAVLVVD